MRSWFVVAREPKEGDEYVSVFGPFLSETDARAFAMDLANDNGWESCEAEFLTIEEASTLTTENILWPYDSEDPEETEEEE